MTATKKKTALARGEREEGKTLRKAATVAICLLTCIITSAIALAHAAPPHPLTLAAPAHLSGKQFTLATPTTPPPTALAPFTWAEVRGFH